MQKRLSRQKSFQLQDTFAQILLSLWRSLELLNPDELIAKVHQWILSLFIESLGSGDPGLGLQGALLRCW